MFKLFINPSNNDHKMFMELLSHKFDNLPYMEITPGKNDNILLMQDGEIVAKNMEELLEIFKVEGIESGSLDIPPGMKSTYSTPPPPKLPIKTAKELKEEWEKEQAEENEDKYEHEYAEKLREYEMARNKVNSAHTKVIKHNVDYNEVDLSKIRIC